MTSPMKELTSALGLDNSSTVATASASDPSEWKVPEGKIWVEKNITSRVKRSPVWTWFRVEVQKGEMQGPGSVAVCIHEGHGGERTIVKGGNTSNLFHHLRKAHSLTPVSEPSDSTCHEKQVGLEHFFKRTKPKHHPTNHPVQLEHNEAEAQMIICGLLPETTVSNPGYIRLVNNANSRIKVQSRFSLSRRIDRLYVERVGSVVRDLSRVPFVHANSDMWTSISGEPFGSSIVSYITIPVSGGAGSAWSLHTVTLRCFLVGDRHTAENLQSFFSRVARQFNIIDKVGVLRTDGARNAVNAGILSQKNACQEYQNWKSIATIMAELKEKIGEDEVVDSDDEYDTYGDDDCLPHVEQEFKPVSVEEIEIHAPYFIHSEVSEFREANTPPTQRFPGSSLSTGNSNPSWKTFLWQHAKCSTHTLQLSVKLGLATAGVKRVLDKVRKIAAKERKSTNLRRELRSSLSRRGMTALSLILDSKTRWGSTRAMGKRYLKVHVAVQDALEMYYQYTDAGKGGEVQQLTAAEVRLLEGVVDTLSVAETISAGFGAETVVTAYMEEGGFWALQDPLKEEETDSNDLKIFKKTVRNDLLARRNAEENGGPNKEWFGIRCAAVLFHPHFKNFNFGGEEDTQILAKKTAKGIIEFVVSEISRRNGGLNHTGGFGGSRNDCAEGDVVEPAGKKRKRNSNVFSIMKSCASDYAVPAQVAYAETLESEWERYRKHPYSEPMTANDTCLQWWGEHGHLFPRVSLGAQYALAIPASSVSSERLFSKAGRAASKGRARLSGDNVEKYVVLCDDLVRKEAALKKSLRN